MTQSPEKLGPRSIETQIEIAAPAETVWKALVEPGELIRWFPLEARVTPGPEGSIWMSWGEPFVAEFRIQIWDPNRRLRAMEVAPKGGELQPAEDGTPRRARIIDFTLETRGGNTLLRLVHSGFGSGSDWDDEIYGAFHRGWQFELRGLRHYLEHHRGRSRAAAWSHMAFQTTPDDAWRRLMGPRGMLQQGSLEGLEEGDRYSIVAANGDTFTGIVHVLEPQRQFSGTVENLKNSLLRVKVERFSGHGDATVWLSTYDVDPTEVTSFQERWNRLLRELLA